ncbi:hypothetical protein ACTXT7_009657 [Hymenolepis weldensis]
MKKTPEKQLSRSLNIQERFCSPENKAPGSSNAVEMVESFVKFIINYQPSSNEMNLLKTLTLFSFGENFSKQASNDRLSSLRIILHQNLPSYIQSCFPGTSEQKGGFLRCFNVIESLPEVACCLIRGALQKIYGFSKDNLEEMIERMAFAAVEAANHAAVDETGNAILIISEFARVEIKVTSLSTTLTLVTLT